MQLLGMFMAMQFQRRGDGYVYRANGRGPALPATAAEFDGFVRAAGWSFLWHVIGFMLAVVAAGVLTAQWFPRGNEPGGMVLMGALMLAIGFALYGSMRRSLLAPQRALAGRTPVETH